MSILIFKAALQNFLQFQPLIIIAAILLPITLFIVFFYNNKKLKIENNEEQVLFSDGVNKIYGLLPFNSSFTYKQYNFSPQSGTTIKPSFSLAYNPFIFQYEAPASADAKLSRASFFITCPDTNKKITMNNNSTYNLPVMGGYTSSITGANLQGFYGITGWLPSNFTVSTASSIQESSSKIKWGLNIGTLSPASQALTYNPIFKVKNLFAPGTQVAKNPWGDTAHMFDVLGEFINYVTKADPTSQTLC